MIIIIIKDQDRKYKGVIDVVLKISRYTLLISWKVKLCVNRYEGLPGFYKGISANLMKLVTIELMHG